MNLCFDCRKEIPNDEFRCSDCYTQTVEETKRRARPMNEYEQMKTSWYRNEKEWVRNIKSRQLIQKNGEKIMLYKTPSGQVREMPQAPKSMWQDPKRMRE